MSKHKKNPLFIILFFAFAGLFSPRSACQSLTRDSSYVASHYIKYEYQIPMRDGVKLFTCVYIPRDTVQNYPIMLNRTPYRVAPYGGDAYKDMLGPSSAFTTEGYIFAYQDVRGKFMSGGNYVNVRPLIEEKKTNTDIDESSDAYDTIEWLINNIKHNNGKAGIWGVSYPGFYSVMASVKAHPALKASSPQAPIADWFIGDDMHHNGAFCTLANTSFFSVFGKEKKELTTKWEKGFLLPTLDGYSFYLKNGTLKNLTYNCRLNEIPFWMEAMEHSNYDEYWQQRNTLPHLKNIKPAVMVVAGLFDAEDLYGAINTYKAIEKQSPGSNNILVLGPWSHGQWERGDGDKLGDINFYQNTGEYYRTNIEFPFFNYYLKGKGTLNLPEALVFETGTNIWKEYEKWPPQNIKEQKIYLNKNSSLTFNEPVKNDAVSYDEYISDPNKPVPFSKDIRNRMNVEYMIEDQRFASTRTDVLVYKSDELETNITLCGPIEVNLNVSTTGTDADFVVKVIDVFPDTVDAPRVTLMSGYQMLVRGDIMRGKFRNSFVKPEPFEPRKITKVSFTMSDVNHTFKKGHRIMIQIQSSLYPLFDMNPQKFVNIYKAAPEDFQKTTERIYFSSEYPSYITVGLLK